MGFQMPLRNCVVQALGREGRQTLRPRGRGGPGIHDGSLSGRETDKAPRRIWAQPGHVRHRVKTLASQQAEARDLFVSGYLLHLPAHSRQPVPASGDKQLKVVSVQLL